MHVLIFHLPSSVFRLPSSGSSGLETREWTSYQISIPATSPSDRQSDRASCSGGPVGSERPPCEIPAREWNQPTTCRVTLCLHPNFVCAHASQDSKEGRRSGEPHEITNNLGFAKPAGMPQCLVGANGLTVPQTPRDSVGHYQ
jgi:hypothetical protein